MAFTNDSIEINSLPSISELVSTPLEQQYRINNRLVSIGTTTLLTCLTLVLAYLPIDSINLAIKEHGYTILTIVLSLGACHLLYRVLADPCKSYALREKDISYTSGLIFRKTITQPLKRIQHIEVERGPIERYTGLATLQVFSAGGAGHTFAVPGLKHDTAMSIRQYILGLKDSKGIGIRDNAQAKLLNNND